MGSQTLRPSAVTGLAARIITEPAFRAFLASAICFCIPAAAQSTPENIDNACISVLGKACYPPPLSSTYDTINSLINTGKLQNTVGTIMNNYLIPMVRSNPSWQANVIDWAWPAAGCKGSPDEATWQSAFAQGRWQTYQQLVNLLVKMPGCTPPPPPPPPPPNYVPAANMTVAYQTVWGVAWNVTPPMSNCPMPAPGGPPVATAAAGCARGALMAFAKANPAVLGTIANGVYQRVIGAPPDAGQLAAVAKLYLFSGGWSGADDLLTYLSRTRNSWAAPPAVLSLKMASDGSLLDGTGKKIPNTAGSFLISVVNGIVYAVGGGTYTAWDGTIAFIVRPGNFGLLMDNRSQPYRIVAQGGGNFQLINSAGIVSQGGGNIVAQGGGNIVAQGGGNIILNGGGNLLSYSAVQAFARTLAGIVSHDGGSLISQDGANIDRARLAIYVKLLH